MVAVDVIAWEVFICCECSAIAKIPEFLITERRRDHKGFFCINGHRQSYQGESIEEKLRKALNVAEMEKTRLTNVVAAERAMVGRFQELAAKQDKSIKRLKTRVAAGVCPCCNRTFKQLGAHMTNMHPEYSK